jgi:hypothetical protein
MVPEPKNHAAPARQFAGLAHAAEDIPGDARHFGLI